jgi:hypothetical protein
MPNQDRQTHTARVARPPWCRRVPWVWSHSRCIHVSLLLVVLIVLCSALPSTAGASGPPFEGSGPFGAYSPSDLRSAYNIPETGGAGQTVAVVVGGDDPKANSDLKEYRRYYHLAECTEANGCFKKVNEKGETKNYPEPSLRDANEIALDIEMVSASCPECHILLIEVQYSEYEAQNEAVLLGATEISNSWSVNEFKTEIPPESETEYDHFFNHPGIPIFVAAGNNAYDGGTKYPASSPYVIAVGGTALHKASNSRGWTEEAWTSTSSGCSKYETAKPPWQHDTGCNNRTANDVAAVASEETPVSEYQSYEKESSPWGWSGGTSAATPLVAGIDAHADEATRALGARVFYDQPGSEFDVQTGSNGLCEGSYLCTAGLGYDGPTGMGTPDGVPKDLRPAENARPAVVRDATSKEQWIFYVDRSHEIAYWRYTNGVWTNWLLGGKAAANTNPTVIRNEASGLQYLYYTGSNGAIWTWEYIPSTKKWANSEVGGSVASGSSPAAVRNESTGDLWVYYIGSSNNTVWKLTYVASAKKWEPAKELGSGTAAANTSPAIVRSEGSGLQYLYYTGSSGAIWTWRYTPSTNAWAKEELGGIASPNTSPVVARKESTGDQWVYYIGSNNAVWKLTYVASAKKWEPAKELGSGAAAANTSPALVRNEASGLQYLYYIGSNKGVWTWEYVSETWGKYEVGGQAGSGATPAVVRNESTGDLWVYYVSNSDTMRGWTYTASTKTWANTELG